MLSPLRYLIFEKVVNLKIRLISLFIATAAIIMACCGVFYAQNPKTEAVNAKSESPKATDFNLNTAQKALRLCELAGYPVSISAELQKNEFEDTEFFQYDNLSKSDNKAGLVLSHKENLLLVIIRGTRDEEWYSNFNIGEGIEHAGFGKASNLVLENIKSYMVNHNLLYENTEVFLTGHSRGAAVANLTAARLTDYDEFRDIKAYTFACPNTTTSENAQAPIYNNIINIVNPQDFICYIPLAVWGYTRYGKTVELPKVSTTGNFYELYSKMEDSYFDSTQKELKDFPHKSQDVENIISYLGYLAPNPQDYYEKEISVGTLRLTMYDYMMKLAAVMNNENPLLHGLFMLSCKAFPEVCPITDFVMGELEGIDINNPVSITETAVVINHMPDAYFAWLNTLDETYFTQRLT